MFDDLSEGMSLTEGRRGERLSCSTFYQTQIQYRQADPWLHPLWPLSGPMGTTEATSEAECGRTQFFTNMISHPGTTESSAASFNKLLSQPCLFQRSFDFHLMPSLRLSHFSPALSRSLSGRLHYNITFKCLNLS